LVTVSDGRAEARSGADASAWDDYARAERFLPWNAAKLVFGVSVEPHWIEGSESFWYRAARRDGVEFAIVDAKRGVKEPAFDHARLAAALSAATGLPYAADGLPFAEIEFGDDGRTVRFAVDKVKWACDLTSYCCTRGDEAKAPADDVVRSPDEKWEAFTREHDLWVRDAASGEERQLTRDGEEGNGYGAALVSPLASAGIDDPAKPIALWSPDSKRVLSCRIDEREALRFHLVQSLPKDGSVRPMLHSYAYPLPGDEKVPKAEVWSFDVEAGTGTKAAIDPLPMLYYGSPLNENFVWWGKGGERVYLLTRDRGYLAYRLTEIETGTGAARLVVEERSERGIDPYLYWAAVNVRVIGGGAEVVWYGHRDGWAHLYLYDGKTGELVRQLTSGPFNVAQVVHVDEKARAVYFTAVGREPGHDPYDEHLYRVSLDGGDVEVLTPDDAFHVASFSPSGRFFLDTASRVDLPPVTTLRTAAGAEVLEVERADVEALAATGVPFPERFTAKARDGVTDVYGVIFRPSRFDPARSYPVIDSIYAGPQRNQAPASFAGSSPIENGRSGPGGGWYWHAQALAELGFVVVMIDGLGMPGRSKAFHDKTYRNLADGGIPDHIAALRQLADRYPYLDLSRVGIYGHSAGGYASAQAILAHPDFYKVAVSSSGNHDHRLDKATWVERYMALPVEEHYREQANQSLAGRLQGKLLLIHGEMDENVHPASTLVLVDALIKANKDFDLLILPNLPHACGNDPYFVRKRWDYFVRHLLGAEPPPGYRITPDS
jgi:dipeptidyl aminopeptidase/acylaminoacyl peptidase